jgi:O-antigen/teichoic acid export membrane protein
VLKKQSVHIKKHYIINYFVNIKTFLYRYLSFTLAKVGILVGRSAILILSFRWLTPIEFAGLAASLSFVEIARAFSELGAESIIYARLSPSGKPIPNIIKKLIRARFLLSGALSFFLIFIFGFIFTSDFWPLFLLPIVGSIQNSNIAFMQKERSYKRILFLVLWVLALSTISVFSSVIFQLKGNALALLMITPEIFSICLGAVFANCAWKQVLSSPKKGGRLVGLSRLRPYIFPSFSVSVIVILYSRLDVLLVLPFLGVTAQADYSIGLRLVEPFFLIMSLASLSILAELGSSNSVNSRVISRELVKKMNLLNFLKFLFFGSFLACFLFWVAKKYLGLSEPALKVLFILALAIPIKLCNTFLSSLLQRAGLFNIVMKAALITLFITFTFGIGLGFGLGVMGIALATIVSESINLLYQKKMVHFMLKDK